MLSKEQRKEAVSKFKERKTPRGVYAVRSSTGAVWVGSSRDLDASKNALWASLRIGTHREKDIQAEWTAVGENAFTYQVLERLDDDVDPLLLWDELKAKKLTWLAQLSARPLL